jgi:hypothetical protein
VQRMGGSEEVIGWGWGWLGQHASTQDLHHPLITFGTGCIRWTRYYPDQFLIAPINFLYIRTSSGFADDIMKAYGESQIRTFYNTCDPSLVALASFPGWVE